MAALGVATTLTMLVLERSRQLNTLIAVGADRGQIRAMIFWEALLLTAAGEVLGLAFGVALSWLLVYVINYQSFGWTFIYTVDCGGCWAVGPVNRGGGGDWGRDTGVSAAGGNGVAGEVI